jgi:hypothetical protein
MQQFAKFRTSKLNRSQFRQGIPDSNPFTSFLVYEALGATFENDEEFNDYFEPIDTD